MALPAAVLLVPLALGVMRRKPTPTRKGDRSGSHKESTVDHTPDRSDSDAAAVMDEALDVPYSYGAGDPSTPYPHGAAGRAGGVGYDCSGYVQGVLVALELLPATAPDRSAASLAKLGFEVPWGQQRPGDVAYYGTPVNHVMMVRTDADEVNGDSGCIGASGGRSTTNADDPNARIKVFRSLRYRKDFRGIRRIS